VKDKGTVENKEDGRKKVYHGADVPFIRGRPFPLVGIVDNSEATF